MGGHGSFLEEEYREENGRFVTGPSLPAPGKKKDRQAGSQSEPPRCRRHRSKGVVATIFFLVVLFFGALLWTLSRDESPTREDPVESEAAPTLSPVPEEKPLSQSELQDLADMGAEFMEAGDAGVLAGFLQEADETTGCDVQAFTSFVKPGDFAKKHVRQRAEESAAEHGWLVAFGISGDTSLAIVQNCTEDAFG